MKGRQRDDDYDYGDHSDHDYYKSESRRYSSRSIHSSRRRSSKDHYDSRSSHYHPRNDHSRQLHFLSFASFHYVSLQQIIDTFPWNTITLQPQKD